MLRNITNYSIRNRLYATATAVPAKKLSEKDSLQPIITCKHKELNLLPNQVRRQEFAKFGSIPLASKGWKHRKSNGDFFTIHPTVDMDTVHNRIQNIDSLQSYKVKEILIKNLSYEGEIEKLTEIQDNSIQKILQGNHVLIAAETGCGKTLAYLIPILNQILKRKLLRGEEKREFNTPYALILTPGRELASQIGNVAEKLSNGTDLKIKTILGGNTKQQMMNPDFQDVDLLIGTMGATSKLVTTGIYRMGQVRFVVLDEADTMLDDSFSEKLCYFLKRFPFHKAHLQNNLSPHELSTQLILASATMPKNIQEILANIVNTETIEQIVSPNLHRIMPHVKQTFLRMNKSDRPHQLINTVKTELKKQRPLIIFGNKSPTSDFISIILNDAGVNCLNLNGDMLMKIRVGRFEQFQRGDVHVLSTTDVASRGLDTTRARHIINFDFPLHVSDYIHRCGRIGRIGSFDNCLVTNFISSQREIDAVQRVEHTARTGGILPNVNANITNLIQKNILKEIRELKENQNIEAF